MLISFPFLLGKGTLPSWTTGSSLKRRFCCFRRDALCYVRNRCIAQAPNLPFRVTWILTCRRLWGWLASHYAVNAVLLPSTVNDREAQLLCRSRVIAALVVCEQANTILFNL